MSESFNGSTDSINLRQRRQKKGLRSIFQKMRSGRSPRSSHATSPQPVDDDEDVRVLAEQLRDDGLEFDDSSHHSPSFVRSINGHSSPMGRHRTARSTNGAVALENGTTDVEDDVEDIDDDLHDESQDTFDTQQVVKCKHHFRHPNPFSTTKLSGSSDSSLGMSTSMSNPNSQAWSLHIILKSGTDLFPSDDNQTSDPFCIFKVEGTKYSHTSSCIKKTLNPVWNEEFSLPMPAPGKKLIIDVYDRDAFVRKEFIGGNVFDTSELPLPTATPQSVNLKLSNVSQGSHRGKKLPEELGFITFEIAAIMGSVKSGKHNILRKKKKSSSEIRSRLITVDVIQGKGFFPMDDNGKADPFVEVTISKKKRTTKVIRKTLQPAWRQRFEFPLHDDSQQLKFEVYDKDFGRKKDFMGAAEVNLSALQIDRPLLTWLKLHPKSGQQHHGSELGEIEVQVLVSNLYADSGRRDVLSAEEMMKFCGTLKVKVLKASNLIVADRTASDPYVELELGNTRLRTKTIKKTVNPVWDRDFEFDVQDVFDVLKVTVYDEDPGDTKDFLGALIIPLLEMPRDTPIWFPLKDKTLMKPMKSGELCLQFVLTYRPIPAYRQLVKRRIKSHLQTDPKFRIGVFVQNVQRLRNVVLAIAGFFKDVDDIFNWNTGAFRSIFFMMVWIFMCFTFQAFYIPLFILLMFLKNYFSTKKSLFVDYASLENYNDDEDDEVDDEEVDEGDSERKQRTGLRERYKQIMQVGQGIQNTVGMIASVCEKIKNLFGWRVPTISMVTCLVLTLVTTVLILVPLRWVLLVWGTRRFIKKALMHYQPFGMFKRPPHHVPFNEGLEFLGRVPDDIELMKRKKLKSRKNMHSFERSISDQDSEGNF